MTIKKMLCPGCNLPMLNGQTFNGAYGCHWDCTDKVREQDRRENPRPPTESDLRWDELKKSIDEVGNLAIRLETENGQLRAQLARACELLHDTSIRISRSYGVNQEPRKQIIAFLEASAAGQARDV